MLSFLINNMILHTIINLDDYRIFHISEILMNDTLTHVYFINFVFTIHRYPKFFEFALHLCHIIVYFCMYMYYSVLCGHLAAIN